MQARYFAYGSNLSSVRMRSRVPSARALGVAHLQGVRLTVDKRGRDGSAKANLADDPAASVWGVLWSIHVEHWSRLDAFEGGYRRLRVQVRLTGGDLVGAETYRSGLLTDDPVLSPEYKRHILAGAREHGLPAEWISLLEALPERPDPEAAGG